jgi:uncharacterized protein YecE (DUF72 family)
VTIQLAIVRFHGHADAAWRKRGASVHERFGYLYSPGELQAWVQPVRALSMQADSVRATFNNWLRDFAQLNAKDFAALLEQTV